jgi:hypothetical protein
MRNEMQTRLVMSHGEHVEFLSYVLMIC